MAAYLLMRKHAMHSHSKIMKDFFRKELMVYPSELNAKFCFIIVTVLLFLDSCFLVGFKCSANHKQ